MLEIEMFPALQGDGLWLRYGTKTKPNHILVDCGFAKQTTPEVIAKIRERDPYFELFVLTHIDADHIDGAVQLMLEPELTSKRVGDVWFRKSLSATLMKNCAVGECGAWVRAIATVYPTFFSPLAASFSISLPVGFCFMPGSKPPPWTMKPGITR